MGIHRSLWSVWGPYEITLLWCNCHMRLPGCLCVFLRFLVQYSMNHYVYPTGFGRCPSGCSGGLCRCRTSFGTPYDQSCRPIWGKYRACRTHKYGCLLDHTWRTRGPKSSEAHLSKLYMLTFQPRAIRPCTGPTMRLIGKQGHKASSYEQRSLIKLSCTRSHITVVTYFHNNSLLACFETNRIKISYFEA